MEPWEINGPLGNKRPLWEIHGPFWEINGPSKYSLGNIWPSGKLTAGNKRREINGPQPSLTASSRLSTGRIFIPDDPIITLASSTLVPWKITKEIEPNQEFSFSNLRMIGAIFVTLYYWNSRNLHINATNESALVLNLWTKEKAKISWQPQRPQMLFFAEKFK